MRKFSLFAIAAVTALAFAGASQATPLSAAGSLAAASASVAADEGVTQVRWHRHYRHYGWDRGRHYGWYHRHHRRHGVAVIIR